MSQGVCCLADFSLKLADSSESWPIRPPRRQELCFGNVLAFLEDARASRRNSRASTHPEIAMKPATEKMLNSALDRIHYTQVEAENFGKRGPQAVRAWKEMAKTHPSDSMKRVLKDVVPLVDKLAGKSKQVNKDLERLHDAGAKPFDYNDGREFRDRNKKLLVAADDFDRQAGIILMRLKSILGGGLYPGMALPAIKPAVTYLAGYMDRWNDLKVAINRI
jgi:hypothetical protein